MAIVLKSVNYGDIKIDSNIIIGVMGKEYDRFLKSLSGNEIYYVSNTKVNNKKVIDVIDSINISLNDDLINMYLENLSLDKSFLNKKVSELSHSEIKLLGYFKALLVNAKIIVIDEPFLDLDYHYKKVIITILYRLIKNKTVIIGSRDSDIVYTLCKKVLLLGNNKYNYDDVIVLSNKRILKTYHVNMPQIVEFIRHANEKKAHLPYSYDIRDLIKDVYKHVTK